MNRLGIPIIFALTFAFAFGQKSEKVVLTGSVAGVSVEKKPQGKHSYIIRLYLSVRNDGDKTIILFRPQDLIYLGGVTSIEMIGKKGDTSDDSVSVDQSSTDRRKLIEAFGWDPVPDSLNYLESQEPMGSGKVVIIAPGGYFEFSHPVSVSNGFTSQPSKDDPTKLEAIPNFRSLKVKYFLKVTRPQVSDDLFRRLQTKWSAYGHLLLNSEGNFSLESEKIPMVIAK